MTEQMLLRFAMILQSQSPSTLNKYICKLAEAVLYERTTKLSLFELNEAINTQFNLSFTEEELDLAISKKGQNRIVSTDGKYSLSPSAIQALSSMPSLTDSLNSIILRFVDISPFTVPVEELSTLLHRYLYYCFNSNVDNLLSLFEKKDASAIKSFEASTDEIAIINAFISWEDSEKDTLVYKLVATCCEYCMLTIKKDNILSTELFKGKHFYLDANIIFRMAGINNEERKAVTTGFVKHCQTAGIELYCTSSTLDEVYRVITAQIEFIRGIAGSSMPVSSSVLESINPSLEINDFYKIYYDWCLTPGNRYGDYVAFNQYLLELIQGTLRQLKFKDSTAYKTGSSTNNFSAQVSNLKEFKNTKRRYRYTSTASAETDITNILDALSWRKGTGTSIWQTNDFIVSADQLLISWTSNTFPGIPIVVLPSVWLSIILRFTGRTDDDYKSFCLFLTQRQHLSETPNIDPIQLLKNVNSKTGQTEIKERIIVEIAQNKAQYSFETTEDYDASTDRAFDKVLEEMYGKASQEISDIREEMRQQMTTLAESANDRVAETEKLTAATEREKTIVALSKKSAADKVKLFRSINDCGWILYVIAGLVSLSLLIAYVFEVSAAYTWLCTILPLKIQPIEIFLAVWAAVTAAIGLIAHGLKKWLSYLGSEKRENKLYQLNYRKNKSIFN